MESPVDLLLVDDQRENLVALESVLARPDYRLTLATSAQDALMALLGTEYALIVLDVEMPGVDGIELARVIKERPKTREVPIIFLTAHHVDERHILSGYGAGAVDYVTKPVNPAILQSKVAAFAELYHANRALKAANAALQREIVERKVAELALQNASRLKSEFLANMSHELRTPLNSILGFSELLHDELPGPLLPKQKAYLGKVLDSGRHLLQLINDVLDLSKVEAGRMELNPSAFSVRQAVDEVLAVVEGIARKKRILLQAEVTPDSLAIVLDAQKFKQILYNLLSNAVKFSHNGDRVRVLARLFGVDRFTIAVRDSGIGIAPTDLPRLFHEFEQLDSGTARRYEGTGLGLVLTKRLVELQGGIISAESELGRGSTFTVELPTAIDSSNP